MNMITRLKSRAEGERLAVGADDVSLGKDVLELVSTAMYVDPLVVYREYVQNAADSIDDTRKSGLLDPDGGTITVRIDPAGRKVLIRDDGAALPADQFVPRMLALGGSGKRGVRDRGFRGVGRLAGLGHAQKLIFRSRADGDADVSEVVWDGKVLRSLMGDSAFVGDLSDLVAEVVDVRRRAPREDEPERFFEVELVAVPRGRSDKLLAVADIADYLAQIAPVPFDPGFDHGRAIAKELKAFGEFSEMTLIVNDMAPLTRPHCNAVMIGPRSSVFETPEFRVIPRHEGGGVAAFAWFLHHDYEGALTAGTHVKGLRLRVGNLQVGDASILEGLFPEARFNGWSVGEVHVFDPRLILNGRRDQLEQNVHYSNLVSQLVPVSRDISHRCRTYSARRSKLRNLDAIEATARDQLSALAQGGLTAGGRSQLLAVAETALQKFRATMTSPRLTADQEALDRRAVTLEDEITQAADEDLSSDPLSRLALPEREFFGRLIEVIYRHSVNQVAAKSLVDRILEHEVPALVDTA